MKNTLRTLALVLFSASLLAQGPDVPPPVVALAGSGPSGWVYVKVDSSGNLLSGGTALTNLNSSIQAPGSATPAKAIQICWTDGSNCVVPFVDYCHRGPLTQYNVNLASTTVVKIASKSTGKFWVVCYVNLGPLATATNVVIVYGTHTTTECDTGTAALVGGGDGTPAKGWNISVGGGIVAQNGGRAIAWTPVTQDICIAASAANQVSGSVLLAGPF